MSTFLLLCPKMHVQITETTTVQPSHPPFQTTHTLPLSHLDTDNNLNIILRYLRVYSNPHHRLSDPFHLITTALSKALVPYYPFASTLQRDHRHESRLHLKCELGKGVMVVKGIVDCELSEVNYLDDMDDDDLVEQLAPDPDPEEDLTRPMMLQVTVFKCGGFVLGAAIHHSLCDGLGATVFFNAVAELARGADRVSVEPVWDREKLLGPREPVLVSFPIGEFLSLDKRFLVYEDSGEKVVRECFQVEEEGLDRFKGVLFEKSGSRFTTFEALGAFIWRAKVKASGVKGDEIVKFAYSINIRKLVKPPLPNGYWGNGCVPMYVQLPAKDLIEQPIWKTAELIKKSKYNTTDEYVHSFIDFQELNYAKGITSGRNVSGFTDWRHLGHSTIDFGSGGPVTVLPLSNKLLGSSEPCFFLPFSSALQGERNGFKVMIYLKEAALLIFREEITKFKRLAIEESAFLQNKM